MDYTTAKDEITQVDFNKVKVELKDLKAEDMFNDSQLLGASPTAEYDVLDYRIIGDHVYIITDNLHNIVIAYDRGNGHGTVLVNMEYNSGNATLSRISNVKPEWEN